MVFKNLVQLGQKTSGFCHAFGGLKALSFTKLGWLFVPLDKAGGSQAGQASTSSPRLEGMP
jgi:hypothetical protein